MPRNSAGDCDFICNYMGNEAWTLQLDWAGGDGFRATPLVDWSPMDGPAAGLSRSYGGLTFLQVYEAGHMVSVLGVVTLLPMCCVVLMFSKR